MSNIEIYESDDGSVRQNGVESEYSPLANANLLNFIKLC